MSRRSPAGGTVTFHSRATNLVPGDTSALTDLVAPGALRAGRADRQQQPGRGSHPLRAPDPRRLDVSDKGGEASLHGRSFAIPTLSHGSRSFACSDYLGPIWN